MPRVVVETDVEMRTRDGVTLRADVYRPDTSDKVPAILLRTPYDKSARYRSLGSLGAMEAARAGFAFVAQDVRGRLASEGEYKLMPSREVEGPDGYDTVEWIASQTWSNGSVGMIGASYESITQIFAAEEAPPGLKAIVPQGGGNSTSLGATFLDATIIAWAAGQAIDRLEKMAAAGEDVMADIGLVMNVLRDPHAAALHLPLETMPIIQLPGVMRYGEMVDSLLHGMSDTYYERITAPAVVVSGWYEMGPGEASALYRGLRDHGGSDVARTGTKLLFGAWDHSGPNLALGERFFGPMASADGALVPAKYLSFFARHLRGDDVPELPNVTYFEMGTNVWKTADEWPPPGTNHRPLYLHSGGRANGTAGDGSLSWSEPSGEDPDRYRYDPLNPVPSFGGKYFYLGGSRPGPFDQSRIESRDDVLVYSSHALDTPLTVAGLPELHVRVSSSARDTDFVVKICDVSPDGISHNVADGFLRMRWRDGVDKTVHTEPGDIYSLTIGMGAIGHVFLPRHRVRLQITSSSFPGHDRNMNTGNALGSDAEGIVAEQTIFHDTQHPSYVLLPVQP